MITLPFTFSSLVSRNASSVESVTISYDTAYDDFSAQVTNLACSSNLTNLGFTNLGSIPGFPYIGGSSAVSSSGSTGCITCWELSYNETNINVLVVDYADEGLNIAQAAMNGLTGGDAQELGILWATAVEVDVTECGM
ncbi:Cerato-platanin [Rhodofomes roseus]|nr:Cerato-platanin [Rhodofomes roseus]KAH9842595.1 Cerato-platanin [Rhodofomes roseus]